jgi:DNA-binding NarL/FixJ family response regulator
VSERIRIVLADDHPIFLAGLRKLICGEEDFELVGEASTGLQALKLVFESKPDVAIIDISMPELNGIALSRRILEALPTVRILVLTLHEDRAYLNQALRAGVRGYLLKRSASDNLVQAVRAVMVGGLYVDPAKAGELFNSEDRKRPAGGSAGSIDAELTAREAETLKFVALGETNKEIARRFEVSVKTVETFKSRGAAKMGLKTRADIVRYAITHGWLNAV